MPPNHLILCRPLLLLPSIFPSIRVFSNESALCIRLPKSFSTSPFSEYSGLISLGFTGLISLQFKGLSESFPELHGLVQFRVLNVSSLLDPDRIVQLASFFLMRNNSQQMLTPSERPSELSRVWCLNFLSLSSGQGGWPQIKWLTFFFWVLTQLCCLTKVRVIIFLKKCKTKLRNSLLGKMQIF